MPNSLRRAVDIAGVLAGIGAAAVIGIYSFRHFEREHKIDTVITSLREFDRAIAVQAAAPGATLTAQGWPMTVEPAWFEGEPPRNILASPERPWLEVATEDQALLTDPPIRIAAQREIAAFWYNPYRGIVRARVPMLISERDTVNLYNRINHAAIAVCVEPFTPAPSPPKTEQSGAAPAETIDELDPTKPEPPTSEDAVPATQMTGADVPSAP